MEILEKPKEYIKPSFVAFARGRTPSRFIVSYDEDRSQDLPELSN